MTMEAGTRISQYEVLSQLARAGWAKFTWPQTPTSTVELRSN